MLMFSLCVTAVVFWYITVEFNLVPKTDTQQIMLEEKIATTTIQTDQNGSESTGVLVEEVLEVGNVDEILPVTSVTEDNAVDSVIALKDLNLSTEQQQIITLAGIDIETFVVTEAMIECAEEKVGQDRITEIIAGGTPGILEIASLLPCIGVE